LNQRLYICRVIDWEIIKQDQLSKTALLPCLSQATGEEPLTVKVWSATTNCVAAVQRRWASRRLTRSLEPHPRCPRRTSPPCPLRQAIQVHFWVPIGGVPRPRHLRPRCGHGPGQGAGHSRLTDTSVGARGAWVFGPRRVLPQVRPRLRQDCSTPHRADEGGLLLEQRGPSSLPGPQDGRDLGSDFGAAGFHQGLHRRV
jgi:hypothetical protein